MEAMDLDIVGAKRIVPQAFSDNRGYFKETFSATRYAHIGIRDDFVQDNVSCSRAHTLRGLHGDPRMAKLVQVLQGAAYDVMVDLRKGSRTFLRFEGLTLTASDHTQLYIPAGCLHGFLALEDDTILSYKQSAEYDPLQEFSVAWNDPDIGIEWPLHGAIPLLSPKDSANQTLRALGYL